jgi:hypothetical protein
MVAEVSMNLREAGITLHARVRTVLERLSRSRKEEPRLVERATIILNGVAGMSHAEQGRQLRLDRQRPRRWTKRWISANEALSVASASPDTSDRELVTMVKAVLSDEYRSGTPPKFTAEQLTRLIALACERPEDLGLPVNRPTPTELAREASKRGIVESISPRHLDRILKRSRPSAP